MTKSRIAVPGATLAVTRRTVERKLLWTPSSGAVQDGYLYALSIAQETEGLEVHHGILMGSHGHHIVTPGYETNLGEAFRLWHREGARFLQEHLLSRGYDAPQQVWDRRPTHAMHLVDAGAQLEHILYQHLNAPKAGLVEKASDWPGWLSPLSLLKGGTIVVPRPDVYFDPKLHPAERELVFTPPPELLRLFGSDLEGLVYWLEKAVEAEERQLKRERVGDVVGAARARRLHPFSEPATYRERRGRRVPRYKVGRGWLPEDRRELEEQLRSEDERFLQEGRDAWGAWIDGDRDAEFPYGTLQMVAQHGASMASMHPDAVLCSPDRSVVWSASPYSARDAASLASGAALDALTDEVEDQRRDGVDPSELAREPSATSDSAAPPEVETRELESPTASAEREHARRLVILRDQNRRRRTREPDS